MEFRTEDLAYQHRNGKPLLARLYQPIGPGPFPAVCEVHGGAWTGGDRLNNVAIAEALAADGIVVLSIDFRMPPEARYPDTVADVNLGVRWLKANAEKFHSRADLVGGLGTSSGGHLILLSAMRPHDSRYAKLPLEGSTVDATVRFVVACWPVADPSRRYRVMQDSGNARLVAAHDAFWPSMADMLDANPTMIPTRRERIAKPPVLIMQGTADNNLTETMASDFTATYNAARGPVELHMFDDQPHAFIPNAPTSPDSLRALDLIKEFIHRQAGC